jgi:DNA-binding MarR family transcriptional regulator
MTEAAPRRKASGTGQLTDEQYGAMEAFRHTLRRILSDSEQACSSLGLTTQRFQALLTIRTFNGPGGVSVGDLAERLLLRHHSAVELVGRLEAAGLVIRASDSSDRRRVLLALTEEGAELLEQLTRIHLDGLAEAQKSFEALLPPGQTPD